MKVTTEDCVEAIINYLSEKEHNFTTAKDWKRISKSGSGNSIIRVFRNSKTTSLINVTSSETEILNVGEENEKKLNIDPHTPEAMKASLDRWLLNKSNLKKFDLSIDFPYKYVYDRATIWLKEEPYDTDLLYDLDYDDLEHYHYERFEIPKGDRIGFGETNWDTDEMSIDGIIEFTKKGYYYNYKEGFICDGTINFEIEKGKGYAPSSEPVDLIETGFYSGGGESISNEEIIKKLVDKYELNVLLIGS